jgi:pimeloyl-ACP methyl ester carboxylesterase
MSITGPSAAERVLIRAGDAELEVFVGRASQPALVTVAAAHPAAVFGEAAVELLEGTAPVRAIAINPRGLGGSSPRSTMTPRALEDMVDEIEAARRALGFGPWVFWGMSGGGWLGQIYAHRHPDALSGLILESICPCFRLRLADPACVLSPFHPAWCDKLQAAGLIDLHSHEREPTESQPTEWIEIDGIGSVFCRAHGPALLVSPTKVSTEMQHAMPALFAVDTRAWLRNVHVPALVVCGTADPIVPIAHARALHEAIPGSSWVAIEGAGHVPTGTRHPELARAVQDFLATCASDRHDN